MMMILIISFSVLCFLETYQLAVGQIIGLIFIVYCFSLFPFHILCLFVLLFEKIYVCPYIHLGFPGGSVVKNPPANAEDAGSIPGLRRFPWRRKCQPTPVFLPGKSHGQRSLVGYSPWVCKRIRHDLTKQQQQIYPYTCYLYAYMHAKLLQLHICMHTDNIYIYAYR